MDGQNEPNPREDDYAAASHSTADYIKHAGAYPPPSTWQGNKIKKPNPKNYLKFGLAAVVIIVVLALAAGGYYLIKHHHKSPKATTSSSIIKPAVKSTSSSSSSTTNYVSNGQDLNLTFSYPNNWSVTPATNDNPNDQPITISSPLTSLPTTTGSTVTGRVIVSVRPGTATISELNSNNPTVGQTSSQIAYSAPTANQYQYPYLTFIHFSTGATTAGAFEEVIVTGPLTFNQGTSLNATELSGIDPILSASFVKCLTQACSTTADQAPLSITNNTWLNIGLFQQTLTLIESFKLN